MIHGDEEEIKNNEGFNQIEYLPALNSENSDISLSIAATLFQEDDETKDYSLYFKI